MEGNTLNDMNINNSYGFLTEYLQEPSLVDESSSFMPRNVAVDEMVSQTSDRSLSAWEKQYLREMKKQAYERGDQREVERLSKLYGNWGI